MGCARFFSRLAFVVLVALAAVPGHAAAQVQAPPQLSQPDQDRIYKLREDARGFRAKGDRDKERAAYEDILKINHEDVFAIQRLAEIDAEIEKERKDKAARESRQQTDDETRKARDSLVQGKLDSASTKIAKVGTGGNDEGLLKSADEDLEAAKANNPTPAQLSEIERLEGASARKRSFLRARWWQIWGGIGLVVLAALGLTLWYFWRRERVLEIVEGDPIGQVFVLKKDQTALGALAGEVDWALPDRMRKVSRHHCDVLRTGRHYFVVDRSTNGTWLNGQQLAKGEPVLLRRGDQIGLGGEVVVRFR